MLRVLLQVKLRELLWVFTGGHRKKKAQSKGLLIAFAGLMLYAMTALGFLFWHIFDTIAAPFHMLGLDWLYYTMTALMAFALMFVGSVFATKAQLYEAKDNDLLLSMPIKPGHILLSRMFILLVLSFVLELPVAIPGCIASAGLSGTGIVLYIGLFLLLPLFYMAVAALFSWLISFISNRFGNSPLLSVILYAVFFGAYMYWAFRMNSLLGALVQNSESIAGTLGAVAPLYWIGASVATGNWGLFARVAVIFLGSFVIACIILARTFVRMATDRRGLKKKVYKERAERAVSPRRALLRREIQRFITSPPYMFNCGLGCIMALIGAVALVVKRGDLLTLPYYEMLQPMLRLGMIAALLFCASTVIITAPSVSLEGKRLWIVQSAPVAAWDVLRAKLEMQLLFSVPPLLAASCAAAWVLEMRGMLLVCALLLPPMFSLFAGLLGLVENLRHPSFDWTNEMQAVKSGMSVLFTLLICMGLVAVPVLAYVLLGGAIPAEGIGLAFLALLAAVSYLLYRWLRKRGAELFTQL